eukprot:jgi/Mesvir1/7431/Mv19212-RA.1
MEEGELGSPGQRSPDSPSHAHQEKRRRIGDEDGAVRDTFSLAELGKNLATGDATGQVSTLGGSVNAQSANAVNAGAQHDASQPSKESGNRGEEFEEGEAGTGHATETSASAQQARLQGAPDGSGNQQKKPTIQVVREKQVLDRQGVLRELSNIYAGYSLLASQELPWSDEGERDAEPGGKGSDGALKAKQEEAFRAILDGAKGFSGARFLAARLIPRFLPSVPSCVDLASRVLLRLFEDKREPEAFTGGGQYEKPPVMRMDMRVSVLQGMVCGCQVAATWDHAAATDGDGTAVVKRVVGFLLQQLPAPATAEAPSARASREASPAGKPAGTPGANWADAAPSGGDATSSSGALAGSGGADKAEKGAVGTEGAINGGASRAPPGGSAEASEGQVRAPGSGGADAAPGQGPPKDKGDVQESEGEGVAKRADRGLAAAGGAVGAGDGSEAAVDGSSFTGDAELAPLTPARMQEALVSIFRAEPRGVLSIMLAALCLRMTGPASEGVGGPAKPGVVTDGSSRAPLAGVADAGTERRASNARRFLETLLSTGAGNSSIDGGVGATVAAASSAGAAGVPEKKLKKAATLIEEVLHPLHETERWLVSAIRNYRWKAHERGAKGPPGGGWGPGGAKPPAHKSLTPAAAATDQLLVRLLQALKSFTGSDLELCPSGGEEEGEISMEVDEPAMPPPFRGPGGRGGHHAAPPFPPGGPGYIGSAHKMADDFFLSLGGPGAAGGVGGGDPLGPEFGKGVPEGLPGREGPLGGPLEPPYGVPVAGRGVFDKGGGAVEPPAAFDYEYERGGWKGGPPHGAHRGFHGGGGMHGGPFHGGRGDGRGDGGWGMGGPGGGWGGGPPGKWRRGGEFGGDSSMFDGGGGGGRGMPLGGRMGGGPGGCPHFGEGETDAADVFPASRHLWIGSLMPRVSEEFLRREFGHFGPIDGVTIFRAREYGFVDFVNVRDAVRARAAMQNFMCCGRPMQIKFGEGGGGRKGAAGPGGQPGGSAPGCQHIWVGGITSQNGKDDLLAGIKGAGIPAPRNVTVLVGASALLLEFERPEDATACLQHIRARRCGVMPGGGKGFRLPPGGGGGPGPSGGGPSGPAPGGGAPPAGAPGPRGSGGGGPAKGGVKAVGEANCAEGWSAPGGVDGGSDCWRALDVANASDCSCDGGMRGEGQGGEGTERGGQGGGGPEGGGGEGKEMGDREERLAFALDLHDAPMVEGGQCCGATRACGSSPLASGTPLEDPRHTGAQREGHAHAAPEAWACDGEPASGEGGRDARGAVGTRCASGAEVVEGASTAGHRAPGCGATRSPACADAASSAWAGAMPQAATTSDGGSMGRDDPTARVPAGGEHLARGRAPVTARSPQRGVGVEVGNRGGDGHVGVRPAAGTLQPPCPPGLACVAPLDRSASTPHRCSGTEGVDVASVPPRVVAEPPRPCDGLCLAVPAGRVDAWAAATCPGGVGPQAPGPQHEHSSTDGQLDAARDDGGGREASGPASPPHAGATTHAIAAPSSCLSVHPVGLVSQLPLPSPAASDLPACLPQHLPTLRRPAAPAQVPAPSGVQAAAPPAPPGSALAVAQALGQLTGASMAAHGGSSAPPAMATNVPANPGPARTPADTGRAALLADAITVVKKRLREDPGARAASVAAMNAAEGLAVLGGSNWRPPPVKVVRREPPPVPAHTAGGVQGLAPGASSHHTGLWQAAPLMAGGGQVSTIGCSATPKTGSGALSHATAPLPRTPLLPLPRSSPADVTHAPTATRTPGGGAAWNGPATAPSLPALAPLPLPAHLAHPGGAQATRAVPTSFSATPPLAPCQLQVLHAFQSKLTPQQLQGLLHTLALPGTACSPSPGQGLLGAAALPFLAPLPPPQTFGLLGATPLLPPPPPSQELQAPPPPPPMSRPLLPPPSPPSQPLEPPCGGRLLPPFSCPSPPLAPTAAASSGLYPYVPTMGAGEHLAPPPPPPPFAVRPACTGSAAPLGQTAEAMAREVPAARAHPGFAPQDGAADSPLSTSYPGVAAPRMDVSSTAGPRPVSVAFHDPRPGPCPASEAAATTRAAVDPLQLWPNQPPQVAPLPLLQGQWSGRLCKSGVPLCMINGQLDGACTVNGQLVATRPPLEPVGWPSVLDVIMRADLTHVLTNVFKGTPAQQRSLLRLTAEEGESNHTQFIKFIEYLVQRQRAGVVKLPPVPGALAPAAPSKSGRMLYLLPPSRSVCSAVGTTCGMKDSILALIVPQSAISSAH